MNLSKPTKIFLTGVALSVLILAAGKLFIHNSESRLKELRAECENKLSVNYVCDPVLLIQLEEPSNPSGGVTTQLVTEQKKLRAIERSYLPISLIVLVIFATPWLWYFTLRRISELSDAIHRK